MDAFHIARLRSLQAVDDLIEAAVALLAELGELENTYVVYTSDNGYHIGAHRLGAGKESPYEEDVRVPFFIRGPGIKKGATTDALGSHVDLAATFATLAGAPAPPALSDGQPAPLHLVAEPGAAFYKPARAYEFVPVEFWGWHADQLDAAAAGSGLGDGRARTGNFTYKAVRTAPLKGAGGGGGGGEAKYVTWCSGERELYNLTADPAELDNLFRVNPGLADAAARTRAGGARAAVAAGKGAPPAPARAEVAASGAADGGALARAWDRLDALVSAFHRCKGAAECVAPLARFLPAGSGGAKGGDAEGSLAAAMAPRHDALFASLPKFYWRGCKMYLDADNEVGAFDGAGVSGGNGGGGSDASKSSSGVPKAASGNSGGRRLAETPAARAAAAPTAEARFEAAVEARAVAVAPDAPEAVAWAGMADWMEQNRVLLNAFI